MDGRRPSSKWSMNCVIHLWHSAFKCRLYTCKVYCHRDEVIIQISELKLSHCLILNRSTGINLRNDWIIGLYLDCVTIILKLCCSYFQYKVDHSTLCTLCFIVQQQQTKCPTNDTTFLRTAQHKFSFCGNKNVINLPFVHTATLCGSTGFSARTGVDFRNPFYSLGQGLSSIEKSLTLLAICMQLVCEFYLLYSRG